MLINSLGLLKSLKKKKKIITIHFCKIVVSGKKEIENTSAYGIGIHMLKVNK